MPGDEREWPAAIPVPVYEQGFDLETALAVHVRDGNLAEVKTNPHYWNRPFVQHDPARRPIWEKVLDVLGLAVHFGRPPRSSYENMTAMKESLVELLRTGVLAGYGFPLPRQSADQPQRVPPDLWVPDLDWVHGTLDGAGLSYASLRVFSRSSLVEVLEEHRPPDRRRTGRPSLQRAVQQAISELSTEGMGLDQAHKVIAPVIRARANTIAGRRTDDAAMLGDDVIRKAVTAWKRR